jgi:hypothetical protein
MEISSPRNFFLHAIRTQSVRPFGCRRSLYISAWIFLEKPQGEDGLGRRDGSQPEEMRVIDVVFS